MQGMSMIYSNRFRRELPTADEALPGRPAPLAALRPHAVNGTPLQPPFPEGMERAMFAMGCFWGAERLFWRQPGVFTTAAGYAGGHTPNPTYEEVCGGRTGHAETVLVVFDPAVIDYRRLMKTFWEEHDPTQGMRQGNDIGTQYRSALFCTTAPQRAQAFASRDAYGLALHRARRPQPITTEVADAPAFYYAEDYHQQYLAKHPSGYCGLRGTGVACTLP